MTIEQRPAITASPQGVFSRDEWSEPLFMLYNVLVQAMRADSDSLNVDSRHIAWQRAGQELGSFPFHPGAQPPFLTLFEQILARDARIQQHVQLIGTDEATQIYRIVYF